MTDYVFEITRTVSFESAHRLPHVPVGHKCGSLHGHSYSVTVGVRAGINKHLGWVVDFGDIDRDLGQIRQQLDHRYLNEIPGLQNPTSELLAVWILERLQAAPYPVSWVRVEETGRSSATVWPADEAARVQNGGAR